MQHYTQSPSPNRGGTGRAGRPIGLRIQAKPDCCHGHRLGNYVTTALGNYVTVDTRRPLGASCGA